MSWVFSHLKQSNDVKSSAFNIHYNDTVTATLQYVIKVFQLLAVCKNMHINVINHIFTRIYCLKFDIFKEE